MKEKHIYKFEANGYTFYVLAENLTQATAFLFDSESVDEDSEYTVTEVPREDWANHSVLNEIFDWDGLDFQEVTRTFEELANTEQCPSVLASNLE